jgi:hypothetical protein
VGGAVTAGLGSLRDIPWSKLATGLLFALTAWWVGLSVLLPFALWFMAACIALFLIDLEVKRLPNSLTLSTYLVVLAGFTLTAAVEDTWSAWVRAALGGTRPGADLRPAGSSSSPGAWGGETPNSR